MLEIAAFLLIVALLVGLPLLLLSVLVKSLVWVVLLPIRLLAAAGGALAALFGGLAKSLFSVAGVLLCLLLLVALPVLILVLPFWIVFRLARPAAA